MDARDDPASMAQVFEDHDVAQAGALAAAAACALVTAALTGVAVRTDAAHYHASTDSVVQDPRERRGGITPSNGAAGEDPPGVPAADEPPS